MRSGKIVDEGGKNHPPDVEEGGLMFHFHHQDDKHHLGTPLKEGSEEPTNQWLYELTQSRKRFRVRIRKATDLVL